MGVGGRVEVGGRFSPGYAHGNGIGASKCADGQVSGRLGGVREVGWCA